MSFQIDNNTLQECCDGYEVVPKEGVEKLKGILILLHGYGASGDDLISLVPALSEELNNYYFFAPNGIEQYKNGGGYQWFEIKDTQSFSDWGKGLLYCQNKSANIIKNKIHEIKQKYILDPNCTISILGFSQGAMLALHLACNGLLSEVQNVVSFSGAFINCQMQSQINKNLKILLLHGKEDSIINYTYSLASKQELDTLGFGSVECIIFNNLGHSISYEGLNIAAKFISSKNV